MADKRIFQLTTTTDLAAKFLAVDKLGNAEAEQFAASEIVTISTAQNVAGVKTITTRLQFVDSTAYILRTGANLTFVDSVTGSKTLADLAGGGVSLGTSGQIPYVNAGGTDFLYSSDVTFNTTTLTFQIPKIRATSLIAATVPQLVTSDPATGELKTWTNVRYSGGIFTVDGTILSPTHQIANALTTITKDGLGNMVFTDAVTGPKTLAQLTTTPLTIGSTTQIPYSNVSGTDFLYSANLVYSAGILSSAGGLKSAALAQSTTAIVTSVASDGTLQTSPNLYWSGNTIYVDNGTYSARYGPETINFTRNSSNYIRATTAGGVILFLTNGRTGAYTESLLYISTTYVELKYGSGTLTDPELRTVAGGVYILNKLGIGASAPATRLDFGTVAADEIFFQTISALGDSNFRLFMQSGPTPAVSGSTISRIGLRYNSGSLYNTGIEFRRGGGTIGGFLTFHTNNGAEKMRLDANGYLGIGDNTPVYRLDITHGANTPGAQLKASTPTGVGGWLTLRNTNTSQAAGAESGRIDFYKSDGSTQGAGYVGRIRSEAIDAGGTYNFIVTTGQDVDGWLGSNGKLTLDYLGNLTTEGVGQVAVSINAGTTNADAWIRFRQVSVTKVAIGYDNTYNAISMQHGSAFAATGNLRLSSIATLGFYGGNNAHFTIDAATATAYIYLQAASTSDSAIYFRQDTTTRTIMGWTNNSYFQIHTGTAFTTLAAADFSIASDGRIYFGSIVSGAPPYNLRYNTSSGEVQYASTSDRRLKSKIKRWDKDALGALLKIPVSHFYLKPEKRFMSGPIAQDVIPHIPEMVGKDPRTGMYILSEPVFNSYFHRAIQQLNEKIELLESQLEKQTA